MNDYPETIIYVDGPGVSCMGEAGDHPKVYYTIGKEGFVICGYCNIKYIYEESDDWWDKVPHRVREDD